ncbi:hypothetical protein Nmel_017178 [Mimus melanotis]
MQLKQRCPLSSSSRQGSALSCGPTVVRCLNLPPMGSCAGV